VKRLIVNADDLGADEARNAGIFEAIRAGSVTSASILANGPALKGALQVVRSLPQKKVSWGIHLNLSEGTPLSVGLSLLTGKEGSLLGKARTHKLLSNPGNPELEKQVAQEIETQIHVLRKAGVRISHLDGHQHVHVFPAAIRAAVRAARIHRIPWVRIPEDPGPNLGAPGIQDSLIAEARNFSRLGAQARPHLKGSGVSTTDYFRGLYLKGKFTLPIMEENLRQLPPGLTELMVHPGRVPAAPIPTPFSAFSNLDREKELETLLDDSFRLALDRNGIELTPFPGTGG
jgi:predicted glycoside hydrolase/deacetylase ChbG (UPF0249 family)